MIMLTAWWLWKRRNTIFDGAQPDVADLIDVIKAEA
jgi:hypothetical protein